MELTIKSIELQSGTYNSYEYVIVNGKYHASNLNASAIGKLLGTTVPAKVFVSKNGFNYLDTIANVEDASNGCPGYTPVHKR